MKATIFISLSLLLVFSACLSLRKPFDILIKDGKIIDGTGNPWYEGDVGIIGDKIKKIGNLHKAKAKVVVDAKGMVVSPGFIDVHTHTDRGIRKHPDVKNYLFQGVTTIVGGNCGSSRFPLRNLYEDLGKKGIALNFASLVGHNTIRKEVMGEDDRKPNDEELAKMCELVKQEMEAGAIGLSTGLAYIPGRYSDTDEIIALTKEIVPFGGFYATHMRNQGEKIREAIEEAIEIGRKVGVRVEISHIKLASELVWGKTELITETIEEARSEGLEICMDQYPYIATSSGFTSSFPGWAVAGGIKEFAKRVNDPQLLPKIREGLRERRFYSPRGINKLRTIYVAHNKNHSEYEGKNLEEILVMQGKKPTVENGIDLVIEMLIEDQPKGIFFQMNEEDVKFLMKKEYNMIASDGAVGVPGEGMPHPRYYGTFPRILGKYVREEGVISLPEAIRKMTSLPAQLCRFNDRGVLKEGFKADIVIFDPETVEDKARFDDPHQYPEGIEWVIVNGKVAAHSNELITKNAGKILKNQMSYQSR